MSYTGAGAIALCKRVHRKYMADAVAESAAAVSYYFLFSSSFHSSCSSPR